MGCLPAELASPPPVHARPMSPSRKATYSGSSLRSPKRPRPSLAAPREASESSAGVAKICGKAVGALQVCVAQVGRHRSRAVSPRSWGALGAVTRGVVPGFMRQDHLRVVYDAAAQLQLALGISHEVVAAVAAHPPHPAPQDTEVWKWRREVAEALGAPAIPTFTVTAAKDGCLHVPCHLQPVVRGGLGILTAVLDAGFPIEARDCCNVTLLQWAIFVANNAALQLLLDRGSSVTTADLCEASRQGRVSTLQLLLRARASPQQEGLCVRFLGALGIQIPLPRPHAEELGKALLSASRAGQLSAVRFLLGQRADIEVREGSHATPLIEAASAGSTEAVKLLLGHGASIEAQKGIDGYTALHCACAAGLVEVARILVASGANLESRGCPICCAGGKGSCGEGVTPLMVGVNEGHLEIIQLLLQGRANVKTQDSKKRSLVELAILRERSSALQLLLDAGAPVSGRCLQVASESRCSRIRIILEGACR
jgi:ankyrin repeat protein